MPAALDYLDRATQRRSQVFSVPPAQARDALQELREILGKTASDARELVFDRWLEVHVTPDGRARMLATLRRKRADAANRSTRRTLKLPAETMQALELLAQQTGGMPLTKLLAAFAAVGGADKELRETLLRVAVAISL